jgi:hypothetical protein
VITLRINAAQDELHALRNQRQKTNNFVELNKNPQGALLVYFRAHVESDCY